jgi:uncharacterized protein YdaU (DUF1376 family)
MSKDPAILFYTSDFLTGTMTMTNEQVGKYIRLLCLQHQKGVLSEKDMLFICGSYDEDIWSKFNHDEHGFYNERLRFEADKRALYSLSRSSNRSTLNKKTTKKHMKKICKTYVKHMENENENINEDINSNINIKKTPEKTLFLDAILLTDAEHQKLIAKYGQEKTDAAITVLNNAIMSKGYKYKSHYHTIIGWPIKEVHREVNNGAGNGFTGSKSAAIAKTGAAQSDGTPWPADREY